MISWTSEQYQAMAIQQNQMTSNEIMLRGLAGSEQNWNQNQGVFIGPIPPEDQDTTMDLTHDEGKDQVPIGDNQGRGRHSENQNNRDSRWNRNRDRDNRDNHRSDRDRSDRGNKGEREREDRRDRNDRSRSNRGRERSSRFSNRDKPLLPGMPGLGGPDGPGGPSLGGPGPDNNMMMPGIMQPYGNNMMPGQPPMDMQNIPNPNIMPGMNVHPNMMGNMIIPGQLPGMMPGQMQGQMLGHMQGHLPPLMQGQMPGQIPRQMQGQMPGMIDQNMMMAQQMQMMGVQPIFLQAGVLLPPIPGSALPPRRERPVGCRTIFVGGLPPGISMEVIKEVFKRFGDIDDVKIHKQGVCHIRFAKQEIVEMSFFLSGFRFKAHEQSENEATTLFIDYALNRDDQNEADRQKREPTPPPIEPFTPAALAALSDKIKSDADFAESAPTLAGWLEKGECNKKNANMFYSLIQACNSQVRRLYNEKIIVDEEFLNFKTTMKDKFAHIIFQFEQVAKILSAAKHKKISDHFSKQQRRNVDMWLKMTEDLANIKEEFSAMFEDDEHEKIGQKTVPAEKYEQLKVENDTLVCELEGYKNEAHLAKDEAERKFEKFKAQYIAQQALQGGRMPQQGIFPPLPPPPPMPGMDPRAPFQPLAPVQPPTPDEMKQKQIASPNEAKLVAMLTAFLLAHPLGATLDYLSSYIRSMLPGPGTTHHGVNTVLQKYSDIFARQGSDRWTFVLFDIVKKEGH